MSATIEIAQRAALTRARERQRERAALAREVGVFWASEELGCCYKTVEAAQLAEAERAIRGRLAERVRVLSPAERAAYQRELLERRRRTGR